MAPTVSLGARNYAGDSGWATMFDGGNGRFNVYTGARPASADNAATGTLLGTLTMASDAAGTTTGGVITWNAVGSDTSADASGTAGYVRMYRSTDTAPGSAAAATDRRLDLAIGTDITIDNASIALNGTIAMSSFTLTVPAS